MHVLKVERHDEYGPVVQAYGSVAQAYFIELCPLFNINLWRDSCRKATLFATLFKSKEFLLHEVAKEAHKDELEKDASVYVNSARRLNSQHIYAIMIKV
jgi:hypothetical protein